MPIITRPSGDWKISNFKIKDDKLVDNEHILTPKDVTNCIKIIYKSI